MGNPISIHNADASDQEVPLTANAHGSMIAA
jgi:hypothetical protein